MNTTGGNMKPIDDTVPPIPGEEGLEGWRDITESALVGIRVLCFHDSPSGTVYATLIKRDSLWDAVFVSTEHGPWQTILQPAELAPTLDSVGGQGLPR